MPNIRIQRIIYKALVQSSRINRTLDRFGGALNRIGIPHATRLTRHKATLFASNNLAETKKAREALLTSGRARGVWAVYDHETGGRTIRQRFQDFILSASIYNDPFRY